MKKKKSIEVCKVLLENKVLKNPEIDLKRTPLHIAAEKGHSEDFPTPLHITAEKGHSEVKKISKRKNQKQKSKLMILKM